jgi:RNA polymerase sigma-70 factor, ECF subfamily
MPFVRQLEPQPAQPTLSPDPRGDWVGRHARGAWRFARLLGCDAHLADDLVQDAMLAALHKGVAVLDDAAASAWLRGAVRNLWRMHLRTQRRRPTVALEVAEEAMERHAGADGSGDGVLDALRRCVTRMNGRARAALDLRYAQAASREHIAQRLGLTTDGVKTLLRRTREALWQCIQRAQHHHP